MPDLLVANPDGSLLHTHPVRPRATVVIGRAGHCNIVIPSGRVSRHHAVVFEFAGDWYAIDLDSTAGLSIESGPVRLHRFSTTSPWVRLGPVVLWMDGLDAARPAPPSRLPATSQSPSSAVVRIMADLGTPPTSRSEPRPLLVAFRRRADGAMRLLDLSHADRILIGSDSRADIVIASEHVKPLQALVFRMGSKWATVGLAEPADDREVATSYGRVTPGWTWRIGPVDATVVVPESVATAPSAPDDEIANDGVDDPNLGSIFASIPGNSAGEDGPTA